MSRSDFRVTLGRRGETLACAVLRRRGYAIVATRYRTRRGEIDIIARDGATLVFVEVKTRTTAGQGTPREAVTRHKRRQIAAVAVEYLAAHAGRRTAPARCRFDIVSVYSPTGEPPRVDLLPNAFTLDDC